MTNESMKNTLTKNEIIDAINHEIGLSSTVCADLVESLLEEFKRGLGKDDAVKIHNFGSFYVHQKKQRVGRNPKTMEEYVISARKVVRFRAAKLLKYRINKKKS